MLWQPQSKELSASSDWIPIEVPVDLVQDPSGEPGPVKSFVEIHCFACVHLIHLAWARAKLQLRAWLPRLATTMLIWLRAAALAPP